MADKLRNLTDLFEHELKDLYSAEEQQCNALPQLKSKATDSKLQQLFDETLKETQTQKERLSRIIDELGIAKDEKCLAMEGLINETEHRLDENATPVVKDAALIGAAQRIEHYEIAGYGTAIAYARRLKKHDIADELEKTLKEEKATDFRLNEAALSDLNEEIAK
ncbi:MAG: ferritin-like domain-containing protein [Candidatus Kapaibacteriales bacterium]